MTNTVKVTVDTFKVGEQAPPFLYHEKLRIGRVEKVGKDFVTLEFDEECPKDKTKFKSFKFEKITLV